MTFLEYIAKRTAGPNGAGDFVRDARRDPNMPDAKTWAELDSYMSSYSDVVRKCARRVWLSYKAALRRAAKR